MVAEQVAAAAVLAVQVVVVAVVAVDPPVPEHKPVDG